MLIVLDAGKEKLLMFIQTLHSASHSFFTILALEYSDAAVPGYFSK